MSNSSNLTYPQYLNQLSSSINSYYSTISSAFGIPCNILSIIIFARLLRNKTNMGFLYIWQCTVDLCVLLFFLLLFRSTVGVSLPNQSDASCKFLTYLRRFILHASSWVAVVITFDRFVFVIYGHSERFKFMKSKLNLTGIILLTFIVILICDIPNLFYYLNPGCRADLPADLGSDVVSICLRTYFPFVLMIVFNVMMLHKIFTQAHLSHKRRSRARKEYLFTFAVIAYDAYFFILNFPLSLYYIFSDVNSYSGALKSGTLFSASYNLANAITSNLAFCVQTCSIFTYLTFNKLFRNELLHLVGTILCISSLKRVQPVTDRARTQSINMQSLEFNH